MTSLDNIEFFDADVEATLVDIREDTRQGAAALSLRGLDALELLARQIARRPSLRDEKKVVQLVGALCRLRPSIAAIGVQAVIAATKARAAVADGAGWGGALLQAVQGERESMERASSAIAQFSRRELGAGQVLATFSWSMTVLETLVALEPKRVLIGEGHALGDGLKAAGWLASRGIDVGVYPDGALPAEVHRAEAVIVGADQLLADGALVNRAGTFPLCLAANHFQVPFFVVCHKIKLSGMRELEIEEGGRFMRELPMGVDGNLPMFDRTPSALIHRVITESGVHTCAEAAEIGRGVNALKASILGV